MKIITVCGSLKFQKEMMEISEKMELLGNCVITPIYPVRDDKKYILKKKLLCLIKCIKRKLNYRMLFWL